MQQAIELAYRGQGLVEPNPMVGCVIAVGDEVIAQGWHARYGGDHAEVAALKNVPQDRQAELAAATLYVTLEPCSHFGKTPPCVKAILDSPIRRVVAARRDPYREVAGAGFEMLREGGVTVEVGVCEDEAALLNAPYDTLLLQNRPWVIAKWAMTLDGKIATHTGDSKWISSAASRAFVHEIRGRVDAIGVGVGTVVADDPMLNARPADDQPAKRQATRVVFDSRAELSPTSKLATTANDLSVLLFVSQSASNSRVNGLEETGCEVVQLAGDGIEQLREAMHELGRRRMTNILVEGGGNLLGRLFDARLIDEVIVFVAPKIIGGKTAVSPISGLGVDKMNSAARIVSMNDPKSPPQWRQLQDDLVIQGRINWETQ